MKALFKELIFTKLLSYPAPMSLKSIENENPYIKINKYMEYIQLDTSNLSVLNLLVINLWYIDEIEKAIELANYALNLHPNDLVLSYNKHCILYNQEPVLCLKFFLTLYDYLLLNKVEIVNILDCIQLLITIITTEYESKYLEYKELFEFVKNCVEKHQFSLQFLLYVYDICFSVSGIGHWQNVYHLVKILHQLDSNFKVCILIKGINLDQVNSIKAEFHKFNIFLISSDVDYITERFYLYYVKTKLFFTAIMPNLCPQNKSYQLIYVPHSMSGIDGLYGNENCEIFGNCDYILTCSKEQSNEFEILRKKGLFLGELFPLGYPKLEFLKTEYQKYSNQKVNSIVFAPMFTYEVTHNIVALPKYGKKIIESIMFHNNVAIFRPHPTSYNRPEMFGKQIDLDAINEINQLYLNKNQNYIYDNNASSYLATYARSKMMITDFSGTAITFALLCERPVIFFRRKESDDFYNQTISLNFVVQEQLGTIVYSIEELNDAIQNIVLNYDSYVLKVRQFKQQFLYNSNLEDLKTKFIEFINQQLNS